MTPGRMIRVKGRGRCMCVRLTRGGALVMDGWGRWWMVRRVADMAPHATKNPPSM